MSEFQPHEETLAAPQLRVWEDLRRGLPGAFVLYGGTAIALRLGHRTSIDFDFFANEPFLPGDLLRRLAWLGDLEPTQSSSNTLTVLALRGGSPVKISFFGGLSFGRVGEPEFARNSRILVASLVDLATTKLKVIQERAEAKDYRDIGALLGSGLMLADMLSAARAVYGELWNPLISLKALVYHSDGDLPSLSAELKQLLTREASGVRDIPEVSRLSDKLAP